MISSHCLLLFCVFLTFHLIEISPVFFLACNLNHVASGQVSDLPEYELLSDAYFSCFTTIQVLSHGSVQSEYLSDTATLAAHNLSNPFLGPNHVASSQVSDSSVC